MNVKQFKRRWLHSKVEPELFYMSTEKMVKKKSKLIIYPVVFRVLTETLDGFYNSLTYTTVRYIKSFVEFVITDLSGNILFKYDENNTTSINSTRIEVEVNDGTYLLKILYTKGYGIVNGEVQEVIVNGDTNFELKFYLRHFKAVTINDDNVEIYSVKQDLAVYIDTVVDVNSASRLSQVDVYELKWDKWVKLLNYNCTPMFLDTWGTATADKTMTNFYMVGYTTDVTITTTSGGMIEVQKRQCGNKLSAWKNETPNTAASKIYEFENNVAYAATSNGYLNTAFVSLAPHEIEITTNTNLSEKKSFLNGELYQSPDSISGRISRRGSLLALQAVMTVYQDIMEGVDVFDIDTITPKRFLGVYGGSCLWKCESIDSTDVKRTGFYALAYTTDRYNSLSNDRASSLVKKYLPIINYFNEDFKLERNRDKKYSGNFYVWNSGTSSSPFSNGVPVTIRSNGTNKTYAGGLMIFDNLSITNINAINNSGSYGISCLSWYAEDYDKY